MKGMTRIVKQKRFNKGSMHLSLLSPLSLKIGLRLKKKSEAEIVYPG